MSLLRPEGPKYVLVDETRRMLDNVGKKASPVNDAFKLEISFELRSLSIPENGK